MCLDIAIKRQYNPLWTVDFIAHVVTHCAAYGLNLTKSEIDSELARVRAGQATCRSKALECWEILVSEKVAGEICVSGTPGCVCPLELTVAVFDRFAKEGVGQEAFRKFLAQSQWRSFSAVVRLDTPLQSRVVHLLERNGFRVVAGTTGQCNVTLERP